MVGIAQGINLDPRTHKFPDQSQCVVTVVGKFHEGVKDFQTITHYDKL